MNGLSSALSHARLIADALASSPPTCRVALFPPATLLSRMATTLSASIVELGAQDCHAQPSGAFTGDLSAEMVKDAGGRLVILGHSERRAVYHETDAVVSEKVAAALRAGLEPIICVGEHREERATGDALAVVCAQLEHSLPPKLDGEAFSIAYEPIWAIGTGDVPTHKDIEIMHTAIRRSLASRFAGADQTPILYGGSANPANAAEILAVPGVNGLLVGGASLMAESFLAIIQAAG
jgi:triosephosphate isomerase